MTKGAAGGRDPVCASVLFVLHWVCKGKGSLQENLAAPVGPKAPQEEKEELSKATKRSLAYPKQSQTLEKVLFVGRCWCDGGLIGEPKTTTSRRRKLLCATRLDQSVVRPDSVVFR